MTKVTVSMTLEVEPYQVKTAEEAMVLALKRAAYGVAAESGTIRVGRRIASTFSQHIRACGWTDRTRS